MRILEPLHKFLRQGMSADQLALCVAVGVVVGNIPILGLSSLLCAGIALMFRLNLPAIQIVQAAMAPLQLVMIIPFVRLGEWLLHAPVQALSIKEGLALISQGAAHAVTVLWTAILHGGFAWLIVAPFLTVTLYQGLRRVFARAVARTS